VTDDADLIAVRTEVVLEVMVGSMHEEAARRAADEGRPDAERLGYHARVVERERFAPAREPIGWLSDLLAGRDAATVAAELAAGEPEERPDPDSGVASWRVPGPGGHVRHYLALRAGDKRGWMRGYFERCCEDAAAPR
jgi:hypothetical protein